MAVGNCYTELSKFILYNFSRYAILQVLQFFFINFIKIVQTDCVCVCVCVVLEKKREWFFNENGYLGFHYSKLRCKKKKKKTKTIIYINEFYEKKGKTLKYNIKGTLKIIILSTQSKKSILTTNYIYSYICKNK